MTNNINAQQLADRVGLAPGTICKYCQAGKIQASKQGRAWAITPESAADFERRLRAGEFDKNQGFSDPSHPIHQMERNWRTRQPSNTVSFTMWMPGELHAWLKSNTPGGGMSAFIIEAIEEKIERS